ncbi:hypothetical protein EUTSA_v10015152mg [Eutrema salsugineum]|uniref:Defensin-like domain-containing protein n=2 Tax=Eutrema salsugineum TaxID=72664 RepID=V4NB14_EUTSA|nr:hypothetical protein EUTSA_v10015152mg [Eutrema salsugineum]
MGSSKMLIIFTLTVLMVISSIHCQPNDLVPGNFAAGEASNTLCFNPCTDKLGDNECKAICVNKKYRNGSCVGFGIPPSSKYCCCEN